MSSIPPAAREAIELARSGDHAGALAKAKAALAANGDDAGLQLFAGLLHSRLMQIDEALPHFRAAVALAPGDPAARLELIRTLTALGSIEEAEALLDSGGLPAREGDRLRAALLARKGDFPAAAALFQGIVAADPRDFESRNQLGACLLSLGRPGEAATAFGESLALRPDQAGIWDKWVDARIAGGTGEAALSELGGAQGLEPQLAAARLLDRLDRPDEAIALLERQTATNPASAALVAALAEMFERRNRIDELAQAVDRLEALAPGFERLLLLRARLALRRKRFAEARAQAEQASPLIDPATRLQLIGEACDRLGAHEEAWAAYAAMNGEDSRSNASAKAEAEDYRQRLEGECEGLDERWAKAWTKGAPGAELPVVLVGFPRSGTTLLDTFLGAHPGLCISEENPLLPAVSAAAGPVSALPAFDQTRIEQLRALYWAEAERFLPDRGKRRLIDKYPFGLVAAPYIERLFPGAPILFVERHPCDVVLSCYFTRFQPSGAAAAFADLAATAQLYASMMRSWSRSRALLPLRVHDVRYEDMVADTAQEIRGVADFLDLEWADAMTGNSAAAEGRGFIKTPSYAQVAEPVYDRSVERWRNYRAQMEDVLPILEPWVEQFGYKL